MPDVTPVGDALRYAERCRADGRLMEAEATCRQILRVQPNTPEAEHLLGIIAHQNGKISEAIEHIRRAIKLAPGIALFHANLGEMLRLAGQPKLAIEEARRAIAIEPNMPAALSNLGVALYELKDFQEAARAQRKAIAAAPDFAEAHGNLGNALYALRRFDEAIEAYRRAVALRSDYVHGWANLGTALHHSGKFDDGIAALRRAIALSPQHAAAHAGLGILLLTRGEFGEGWDEYEWRLRSTEPTGPRVPERPWQGESLAGKHIYVQAEQGFGDTLQFARYVPLLARRADRVTLRVHQQLLTLLRESLPGITVLGDRGDAAPYQCDAVLMSLPRLFKTRLETIPADMPRLRVPADAAQRWQNRLATMQGVRIGLVWAGNPEHVNDTRRSIDLKLLTPLFVVPGTSFVSLQHGPRSTDLSKLRGVAAIEDLGSQFADFTDTAAAISALDLVITVDTAVAHLAGGLGKPVWVLLPRITDWRWMLRREDSPWYPTMRLFRQGHGDAWDDVLSLLAGELTAITRGDTARLMPFKAGGERRAAQAAAIMAVEETQAMATAVPPAQAVPSGPALAGVEQKRGHGFLADPDGLARRAAEAGPGNAPAAHMLGIIAYQSGKLSEAIDHIRRAIAIDPGVALYHADIGEMYRLAGRIEDSIAAGRHAIAVDPANAGAHSNLGIALFDQGKFEEALGCHDRAIALQDNFVQAHSNRGNALQRLKRFAEAEVSYRRAIELQPAFAEAWNNLGTCLRELKCSAEAEVVYRKALALGPNIPDTLDNLALALKDLDRLDEAAELLRRALVIEPRSDKFHLHYGTVLLDQQKVDEAAAAAAQALALNPDNHDTVNLTGRIAFEQGDLHGALARYRRALSLNPHIADAYNNLGNALKELGHLHEAEEAYLQALRLDPNIAGVYVNLSDSRRFSSGDPLLADMEALACKPDGLSRDDRMQIDFALGKAFADLGDYTRSFQHLLAGNAAKRTKLAYNEQAALALFDRIERMFTPELIRAKDGGGDPSATPIFILGMPRSGTTLVEQIIASHPMVHGAGELRIFSDVVQSFRGADGNTIPYPDFVPALDGKTLGQTGAHYMARLRELAAPDSADEIKRAARITDKMPSNYYFIGLIHLALPNAKIIHCMRDPIDTCISCFSKLFSAEQNHTYDLAELGRYYVRYERLMNHWRRVLPAAAFLDVRYEDVVVDLQGQARRLTDYCGLPWDERCLSFHNTARPVRTASAAQVRKPIYKSAIGRWRGYGDALAPLLRALNGDTAAGISSAAPRPAAVTRRKPRSRS
jgi:tetratricopeptide (TPR) repeat protein